MTSRMINGLVLLVVGAILLMNTTGYLPWTIWNAALAYWPVIVIGLGLQIALAHWRFPGIALAMVVILILAAMNPYAGPALPFVNWGIGGSRRPAEGRKQWSVPLKPSTSRLELSLQAASLELTAKGDSRLNATQPGNALSSELSWDRDQPQWSSQEVSETLRASIKSLIEGSNAGRQYWDVALNPSLATSMNVSGGVANLVLDMTSVYLDNLNVASGVARVDLTLGLSGKETRVNVTGGVGNVSLIVPEAVGIKVTLIGPPAVMNDFSKQGLSKTGNTWTTPDYANATTKVDLSMTCGSGKVTLSRVGWD